MSPQSKPDPARKRIVVAVALLSLTWPWASKAASAFDIQSQMQQQSAAAAQDKKRHETNARAEASSLRAEASTARKNATARATGVGAGTGAAVAGSVAGATVGNQAGALQGVMASTAAAVQVQAQIQQQQRNEAEKKMQAAQRSLREQMGNAGNGTARAHSAMQQAEPLKPSAASPSRPREILAGPVMPAPGDAAKPPLPLPSPGPRDGMRPRVPPLPSPDPRDTMRPAVPVPPVPSPDPRSAFTPPLDPVTGGMKSAAEAVFGSKKDAPAEPNVRTRQHAQTRPQPSVQRTPAHPVRDTAAVNMTDRNATTGSAKDNVAAQHKAIAESLQQFGNSGKAGAQATQTKQQQQQATAQREATTRATAQVAAAEAATRRSAEAAKAITAGQASVRAEREKSPTAVGKTVEPAIDKPLERKPAQSADRGNEQERRRAARQAMEAELSLRNGDRERAVEDVTATKAAPAPQPSRDRLHQQESMQRLIEAQREKQQRMREMQP